MSVPYFVMHMFIKYYLLKQVKSNWKSLKCFGTDIGQLLCTESVGTEKEFFLKISVLLAIPRAKSEYLLEKKNT